MPTRRAIFSSFVAPRESASLEEGVVKWVLDGAIGKTLGSKSIATLTGSQWGESWSSFQHPQQYWENYDSNWEDTGKTFGVLGDSGVPVTGIYSLNTDSDLDTAVVFLYLKNLGNTSTQGLKLSLDGSNYKIYIPPEGSVNIRTNGVTLQDLKVNKVTDNTSIEYILAI